MYLSLYTNTVNDAFNSTQDQVSSWISNDIMIKMCNK